MKLFLSPHNDDEALFGAYTLMREHPLVVIVTDSWIQFNRGDNITADQRWEETKEAMKILNCPVIRLGLRDDVVSEWEITDKLKKFSGFDTVYAPAIQGGHVQHDLIGKLAQQVFFYVKQYTTYTHEELWTKGTYEMKPTPEEIELKDKVLACYKSQLGINAAHFDAVKGKSEWII
jgi:LmbE family N-acetylglucosaminyl deacetylase